MTNILYSWQFNSKKERSSLWYIITFSIAIWLIIWGFLSKQYWMSIVIIILLWFVFYIENNSNDIISVQITDKWVSVSDAFYPFSQIKNYSIIYEWNNAILLRLKNEKKIWEVNIDINIDNSIVSDLQNVLSKFLEENKKEELTFLEKVIRILKI